MASIKKTITLLCVILVCIFGCPSSYAFEVNEIPILGEIDPPPDLNFTVNSTCTRHAYFLQATADASGNFAIFSLHVNPDDFSDVDFKKVYIDVYRSDGNFWCELSFNTPFAFTFELDNEHVNIYFYSSLMVYDLVADELVYYAIPENAAESFGKNEQLLSSNFTIGDWEYICKKGFNGYTRLSRRNDVQEQILIEMPGSDDLVMKTVIPGAVFGFAMTAVIIWFGKKKKK